MIDRQLLVSPERTPTLGTVTRATDSSFNCEVSFRGRSYECKSAGKNALAVGDSVSFVQIDQTPWVIKSDALYPTRFKRPLTDWAGHHKYNLLLQYLISKGARKNYTFQFGTAQSVVSTNVLSVNCWDGRTRRLPVEYAGVAKTASDFSAGDQVLLFQKNNQNWVVIGKSGPLAPVVLMTIVYGQIRDGFYWCSPNGAIGAEYLNIPSSALPASITFRWRGVDPNPAGWSSPASFPAPHSICLTILNIKSTGSQGVGAAVSMQAWSGLPDAFHYPVGAPVQTTLSEVPQSLYLEQVLPVTQPNYDGIFGVDYYAGHIAVAITQP